MKLLVLGGSKAQRQCIDEAHEEGHQVVVCDYLPDSVGHQLADESHLVSTFDENGVYQVAKDEMVQGIMTMGTDQPVYTGACVSHKLGLPYLLSMETALGVTNKKTMKAIFDAHDIPTVKYRLMDIPLVEDLLEAQMRHEYDEDMLEARVIQSRGEACDDEYRKVLGLKFPLVMKPVDSQGQRGIFYLEDLAGMRDHIEETFSYSRQDQVLVEEYYRHDEVTFSGWVMGGKLYPLILSDRVTFQDKDQIGICLSHEWPSKYFKDYGQEIIDLSDRIVKAFTIEEGPVYFQFLIGEEGIKVNEIAARIGGAYEGVFIPEVTGFSMVKAQINAQLGLAYDADPLIHYDIFQDHKHISVQLFFVEACQIAYMPEESQVMEMEGVIDCGFNVHEGDHTPAIQNATARGGYIVLEGKNRQDLEVRLKKLYESFRIEDEDGNNRLIHTDYETYRKSYFHKPC